MQLPEGKGAHFTALLKSCQLRTHTKQAMEVPTTEEDYAQIRMAIQSAKSLFPDHESVIAFLSPSTLLYNLLLLLGAQVLLLEVEQIVNEGDMDTAIKVVEKASRSGNYDEFIILNLKATINTNLAFMALNQGDQAGAQTHLVEVNQCYDKALLLDPESLEVKAQFAQMKSLFGDFDGASKLYNEALSIARSKDEVIDLLSVISCNFTAPFSCHFHINSLRCCLITTLRWQLLRKSSAPANNLTPSDHLPPALHCL
jgi:tetratricopeptide (TPR) repeat protein